MKKEPKSRSKKERDPVGGADPRSRDPKGDPAAENRKTDQPDRTQEPVSRF